MTYLAPPEAETALKHAKRTSTRKPAYLRIADLLQSEVRSRSLSPDARIGSQREFAERFDVSSITVEAALRELQERGVVYRIRGKGTYVAEPTQAIPGTLRIGVVGHEHTNWETNLYVRDIFQSIQTYARVNECYVRFIEREANYASLLDERVVDGLVLITPTPESLNSSGLTPSRHAYAVIGADFENHPSVTIDNGAMVRTALDHLAALGHRDIALVTDPLTYWDTSRRWDAFREYYSERGWIIRPEWVLNWPGWIINGEHDEAKVYDHLCGRKVPTAILALGSFFGTDLIRIMESRGKRVPEDISILGLDLPPFGTPGQERLTTMLQPTRDIGTQAMQSVWDQIRQGRGMRKITLPCLMRTGTTTARI